jgi:hypothetical protein
MYGDYPGRPSARQALAKRIMEDDPRWKPKTMGNRRGNAYAADVWRMTHSPPSSVNNPYKLKRRAI